MTDYHPLIARAVDGLGRSSTGEARRALYERARAALVAQLRGVDPPLSESDITKERLSLEEAIRRVEADAARKSRTDQRGDSRGESRAEPRATPRSDTRAESRPEPRTAARTAPRPEPRSEPRYERLQPPPQPEVPAEPSPEPRATLRTGARAEPRFEPRPLLRPKPPEPATQPRARRDSDDVPPLLRDEPPDDFDAPRLPEEPEPEAPLSARSRLLGARAPADKVFSATQKALKGFRDVASEVDDLGGASARAAQSARETRDSYGPFSRQRSAQTDDGPPPPLPLQGHSDLDHVEHDDLTDDEYDSEQQSHGLEPSFQFDDEEPPFVQPPLRPPHPPRPGIDEDEFVEPKPPRSYRGIAKLAVVLLLFLGLAAAVSWQWSNITGLFAKLGSRQANQTVQQTPTTSPKFPGRVPQEGQPSSSAPGSQTAPAVAQRVVLYEEDPNDPQGKRYVGSAIWRTETVSPGPGLAPELAVRADVEIPERRMTVTWSLRRNTDKALPASHTIEIMFNLPADFPGGGISNVPGVLMKEAEQARGTPLAGLAVKVTTGFFLIGLSAVDADVQRNVQLLKDREWFDIPIVYTNGGRAILALEKGPPGDRAFADAFAAWGK